MQKYKMRFTLLSISVMLAFFAYLRMDEGLLLLLANSANIISLQTLVSVGSPTAKECSVHRGTDRARQLAESAVKTGTSDATAWTSLAHSYWSDGDCAEAASAFERAAMLQPSRVSNWFHFGRFLDKLGQSEQALIAWQRADAWKYFVNLGGFVRTSERTESLRLFEVATKVGPLSPIAWRELANEYSARGKKPESASAWKQVAALSMQGADDYWWALGEMAYHEDNQVTAIGYFLEGATVTSNPTPFFEKLGIIYRELGMGLQAIEIYKKLIEIDPSRIQPYLNMGHVYREQNNVKDARYWYEKAGTVDSKSEWPWIWMGVSASLQKDFGSARSFFESALQRNPGSAAAYYYQSGALVAGGEIDQAINSLETAITLSKEPPYQYWLTLGLLYEQVGNQALAIKAMRSARDLAPENVWANIDENTRRLQAVVN